jgi:type IV pilus assembly protein PilY1
MTNRFAIERIVLSGLTAMTLGFISATGARAAELDLSNVPLFLDLGVQPDVVLSMDTSGSMRQCFVIPGGIDTANHPGVFEEYDPDNEWGTAYGGVASADLNKLYYDPTITYPIPVDGTGQPLNASSQTTFTNAYIDGYKPSAGTKNLSNNFAPCWYRPTTFVDPYNPGPIPPVVTDPPPAPVGQRAYYLEYDGSGAKTQLTSFTKHVVGTASDPSFGGDAAKQEQNFAIWYSYYRNRLSVMKAAAGLAGADPTLDRRIRLAYQNLWGKNGTSSTRQDISLMQLYTGQARTDFYAWLYALTPSGNTPLRYTLDKVGHYFQSQKIDGTAAGHGYIDMAAIDNPWAFVPGQTLDPQLSCRQAFHVLMTDGLWNVDAGVSTNVDGTSATYPEALDDAGTITTYTPGAPYSDSDAATLADNAFKYWVTDLNTSLDNNLPRFMPDPTPHPLTGKVEDNPKNDPATWQHLVNFTLSFGIDGQLPFNDTTYNGLLNGTTSWTGNEVDDLWHAAINSRGQYVRAQNPRDLVDAFNKAINETLARTSSAAAVALNTASLDANSRLYQARFNSANWSGTVLAFDVDDVTGVVAASPAWDAGALLTTMVQGTGWDSARVVLTHNGTQGVPFRWANMTAAMQTELNKNGQGIADAAGSEQGQARLEYLRGSAANEGTGNNYRARSGGKVGDIVDSAPAFVGAPAFNYPDNLETAAYSSFRTARQLRTPMVYVGGNDGMLHGFDANSGQEKIAYVPRVVYPDLTRLTASPYSHRFFVDGSPTVGDAFYGGAWHTALVGGLRKGGQGIYALDVTDPTKFDESGANAALIAMWEFTDANDADLGYSYSRPAIVRMKNGKWAAVFGNGYNNTEADGNASSTGNAVLYVVDMETGSVIKKIDTGVGTSADPTGTSRANGLATPAPVDVDGDRVIDYIYAGDLFGELWKFDVNNSDPANWGIAYGGSPLYVAKDASGVPQPITSRPEVGLHPVFKTGSVFFANGGYMVYFGTGKYIETNDNDTSGAQTQSFYGVWDPDRSTLPPSLDRDHLLQQSINGQVMTTIGGLDFDVRLVSDNTIVWRDDPLVDSGGDMGWFMDLIDLGATPLDNEGERQVTEPILRPDGRIVFTTLIPSGTTCVFGGSGFLMELDATDGGRLSDAPFDFDNDGVFDLVDNGFGEIVVPGGVRSKVGAPSTPGILPANQREEFKYLSGTDAGKIDVIHESGSSGPLDKGTRQSWRQIQ